MGINLSTTFEDRMPDELIAQLHEDAKDFGRVRVNTIKGRKYNGNFKISEKQFNEEIAYAWLAGNLSAAELFLRKVDMDETATRACIQAELHLFLLECLKCIKVQMPQLKMKVELEDLICGKFSTENYLAKNGLKLPDRLKVPKLEVLT